MSKWDWIHAGLEVATYAKVHKANQDLAGLKNVTEVETARRALIEAMRNFIFEISSDIQLAEEQLTEFPQQAFIVSRSLDWRFSSSGISPEVFPDIQDKEYVHNTQKKIIEVVEKAKASLTQQQIQQSETAVQYIIEMPILQQAFVAKGANESLFATQEQWGKLNGRKSRNDLLLVLGGVGIVMSVCAGIPTVSTGLGMLTSGDLGGIITGIVILAIGGFLSVGSFALIILGCKTNPEYAPLKAKRKEWQEQLMSQEENQQVVSTFGDLTSEQFKKVYEERLAFLNPLLGERYNDYLLS